MRTEALRLSRIQKSSGGELVLSDLNLCFFGGALHTVLMQNSSGRRALMDMLSGASAQDHGEIYLFDAPYRVQSIQHAKRSGIFCIGHRSHLVPGLSIAENLFLTDNRYVRLGFTDSRIQNHAAERLLSFARLDHLMPRQLAGTLPIHEAHMVEILRAISQDARIIVFENVMERYSDTEMQRMLRFISTLKESGRCIILLSNKYNTPFDVADYASIVHHGATLVNYAKGSITRNTLLRHLNAQTHQRTRAQPHAQRRAILQLKDVTVPGVPAPIQWSVRAGEVTGVWDQEFSHSHDLLRALFGRVPSGGTALLDGKVLQRRNYRSVLKQGLILIPERESLNYIFPNMGLEENITLMMRSPLYRFGMRSELMQRFASRHVLSVLQSDRLLRHLEDRHAELPLLRRQEQLQVMVAKWLCCRPKVLVFVNPFLLYDDLTIHELQRMMDHLCREGIGIVVISMNLREIKQVADRIYHFQDALVALP